MERKFRDLFDRKKLIIFDLDGTLINSLGVWNEVDRVIISKIRTDGKPTTENTQILRDYALRIFSANENPYFSYYGLMKERYGAKESIEEIHAMRYQMATELLINQVDYKPFVDTVIKKLKAENKLLAIGSTTTSNNLNIYRTQNKNVINKAPLDDYFDLMLTRNDVKEIKPSPEVFLKIMGHFNVNSSETLVIEDSLVGLECAHNANIECLIIYDANNEQDFEKINASADYVIKAFSELL